ncbi:hypothetical protein BC831DRAFT_440922 [Entophlyctis helioformis]|nr:hypothetical protein BC831DRAFT_440922 [Entophlyctis helioformis]
MDRMSPTKTAAQPQPDTQPHTQPDTQPDTQPHTQPLPDAEAPSLLSIQQDLQRAIDLIARDQPLDALNLCSAIMETICTNVETLGLVDPDSPPDGDDDQDDDKDSDYGSRSQPSSRQRKSAVSASGRRPSVSATPTAPAKRHKTAETHAGAPTRRALSVQDRIEFWRQINSTWILGLQTASTLLESAVVSESTRHVAGSSSSSINSRRLSSAANRRGVGKPPPPSTASGGASASASASAPQLLTHDDWIALRDNILDCGDVLELYGLVDFSMGFGETEIVEMIHATLIRLKDTL